MAWILAMVVLAVIVLAVAAFATYTEGGGSGRLGAVVLGIGAGLAVILSFLFSIHQVNEGHVGLVYRFGAIVDQTGDGIVMTAPWEDVRSANVQQQSYGFWDLQAGSFETQDVFIDIIVNYRVSPEAIQRLYSEVGPNYFDVLVRPQLVQIAKDELVQLPAVEATRKRDEITAAVTARLTEFLAPYSVTVTSLTIDDIGYSGEFNSAIERKQVATQNAQEAEARVAEKEFIARGQEAEALGRANSVVIEAKGQADANTLLTASLTPALIQWQAVQKLSDNIQIALIPSGENIIIDPAALLGSTP